MSQRIEHPSLETAPAGSIRFNTDSAKMEIYNGEQWWNIDIALDPDGNSGGGNRAVNGSGYTNPAATNVIEYVEISTLGNAADFGDLTNAQSYRSACSSFTRGYWFNGQNVQNIDTVNINMTTSTHMHYFCFMNDIEY